MYAIRSYYVARIEGTASLRHTSQLRPQTTKQRGLSRGGASSLAMHSVPQVAAGELEENVLQVV